MIIIIPLGGVGKRFSDYGFKDPKPLVQVQGKKIISWVLSSLKLSKNDKIYILYNRILEEFNFERRILAEYTNVNFFKLPKSTKGPVETISLFCKFMKKELIKDSVFILDGDTFYSKNIISKLSNKKNSCILYFHTNEKNPIYSYIKVNKKNRVTDIAEKIKISQNANIGYYFSSFEILKKFSTITIKKKSKKAYVSDIYRVMLDNKVPIDSLKISNKNFNILGTPDQIKLFAKKHKTKKKIFCFDLDNTLVTRPIITGDYNTALPIYVNIKFLRSLYEDGHKIIIYSARRMRTFKSNLNLVKKNIEKLTISQLKAFKIPYHQLILGKPYAHFYIDDLSVNSYENLPFALGYDYEKNTSREFNNVTVGENYTVKSSKNIKKIKNEIKYIKNLPISIKNYFPEILEQGKNFYKMETVKGISYSYLYLNKLLLNADINLLFYSLNKIHNLKNINKLLSKNNIYKNYAIKFKQRLKNIDLNLKNDFKNHILDILNFLDSYEEKKIGQIGLIHGDPVFSNIFKNLDNTIKFIDPRAGELNNFSMYGDVFYDYAKVYQSLVGFEQITSHQKTNDSFFLEKKIYFENCFIKFFDEKKFKNLQFITSSLLISLIPMQDKKNSLKFMKLSKKILS
jgi:capsule biosynthesis phosphatase